MHDIVFQFVSRSKIKYCEVLRLGWTCISVCMIQDQFSRGSALPECSLFHTDRKTNTKERQHEIESLSLREQRAEFQRDRPASSGSEEKVERKLGFYALDMKVATGMHPRNT